MLGRFRQDRLAEEARLGGDADEYRGMGIPDYILKTDAVGIIQLPALQRHTALGEGFLRDLQQRVALDQQALHVSGEDALPGLLVRKALLLQHGADAHGDAGPCLAHPHDGVALVLEPALLDAHGRHQGRQGRGTRALDVIVEGEDALSVAIEVLESGLLGKVFPLQQGAGEVALHAEDEFLHHFLVVGASQAGPPDAQVEGIFEQSWVVGADVQTDRQTYGGVHASDGDVEAYLAY